MQPNSSTSDALAAFPFLNVSITLSDLETELPEHLAKAVDISMDKGSSESVG